MTRKSRTRHMVCFLAALSALTLIPPSAYADFRVAGELNVFAYGATAYNKEFNIAGQASLSDSASVTGTVEDFANGAYYTNLATGSLGTRAYAYSDYDVGSQVGGASSTAYAAFWDKLTFSIPAGTYAKDLYVTLNGHLDGTIGTGGSDPEHLATATQEWYFRFASGLGGSVQFDSGLGTGLCTDPITNTDFSLTPKILSGGTYDSDRTATVWLTAYLKSIASAPTQEGSDAWADVDFYSTGRFLSLNRRPSSAT